MGRHVSSSSSSTTTATAVKRYSSPVFLLLSFALLFGGPAGAAALASGGGGGDKVTNTIRVDNAHDATTSTSSSASFSSEWGRRLQLAKRGAPSREVDDYHYIFSADCKPYMDWQSVALYYSWAGTRDGVVTTHPSPSTHHTPATHLQPHRGGRTLPALVVCFDVNTDV